MAGTNERFGLSDAVMAQGEIADILLDHGMNPDNVKQMVILGSVSGDFADDYLDARNAGKTSGPVKIPFNRIYSRLPGDVRLVGDAIPGHDNSLVIGPLKGGNDNMLVMAQSGREHPYQGLSSEVVGRKSEIIRRLNEWMRSVGLKEELPDESVSTKRATFWLRVAQLMGVQDLIGSNAAGIVTPDTLELNSLMLMHSDIDLGNDNPLRGLNDERFGPRFPHMGDVYPAASRELMQKVAKEFGITLHEGLYVREPGPNYESTHEIYRLRGIAKEIWLEGQNRGDSRYQDKPKVTVGMSSTFENLVAQQASQSEKYPAFKRRAWISAATNYGALLGPDGPMRGQVLDHKHVKDAANLIKIDAGRLMQGGLLEFRKVA